MSPEALLARIDARTCLDFLARMVQQQSYTQTEDERELVSFMLREMQVVGLDASLTPVPGGRVNAVGRWRGVGGGKSLLFNGHLDTNPATEGWTIDPWAGEIDDNFVYGIGVSNMKAGDAAYFCALRTLIEAGVRLKGDVILTYVVGELQGGVGTAALIDDGIRADYFINAEPTDLVALTMHAAAFVFTVELIGRTRHMSKREDRGCLRSHSATQRDDLLRGALPGARRHQPRPSRRRTWRARAPAARMAPATGRRLGSGRFAPGQTQASALADIEAMLGDLRTRFPGLETRLIAEEG